MFTEELWKNYSQQEAGNYKTLNGKPRYLKKGYVHLDHRFWFPERKDELRKLLQNKLQVKNKDTGKPESWAFNPFLKILVKTPRYRYQDTESQYGLETKVRPICFASHIDSLIFGFYSYGLTRQYEKYIKEKGFDECVLAYRSDLGKCNIQFAKEVFEYVREQEECTAIALDIKGYFDNIDHKTLKEKWCKVIREKQLPSDQFKIFNALTKYSYVSKASIYRKYRINEKRLRKQRQLPSMLLEVIPGKGHGKYAQLKKDGLITMNESCNQKTESPIGIPQGSALSALLSNIYLIDYDKMMISKAREVGFLYRRYCDDIIIICKTDKANELKRVTIAEIEKYGLVIQDKKVETIDFIKNDKGLLRGFRRDKASALNPASPTANNQKRLYKNLQYLGFEFTGQTIFVRSSSLSRYFWKMKSRIVKTVSMAYSPSGKSDKIFRKQLLNRYSHLGRRNFLRYLANAAKKEYRNSKGERKKGMDSPAISQQVARHITVLQQTLDNKNAQRFKLKGAQGKVTFKKST